MSQTIQEVMDAVLRRIPGAPLEDTVDTIKAGDPSQPVRGIVTTFLANRAVLRQAVELGANLIITHEPTFYNRRDEVDWLEGDPVYAAKRQFIEEHGLTIWRCHDYWHMHRPDGILTGVVKVLGWQEYADSENDILFNIPPMPLDELAAQLKARLGIGAQRGTMRGVVRVAGDPSLVCQRACLLLGAAGGVPQMHLLGQAGVDVLVCGESAEWETCEYVRDSAFAGQPKALIVLGHANSEEAGMAWLAQWLKPLVTGVPVTHVPVGDPFHWV